MMATMYDAFVNSASLSALDERIIVTDIRGKKPDTRVSIAERPVNAGSFLVNAKRKSLSVSIAFVLWERDIAQRRALLDKVLTWANGDPVWLGTSEQPGRYLIARMEPMPVIPSAAKWTEEIVITFTANEFPHWREIEYGQATVGYYEQGSLYVPGNADTLVSVDVKNTGTADISAVYLYVGDTQMGFYGITLPPGETLSIGYSERNLLYAKIGEVSVLDKRDVNSNDDFVMKSGQHTGVLAVASDVNFSAAFKAQGAYL